MMISKIVVLIEEQVKFRVTEEVAEQLGKMMIKSKLLNQSHEKTMTKSHDGKSVKDMLLEMDSSTSELNQNVSVLDMEQSYSKTIDKIDEETEDDCTITQKGDSAERASIIQSRVTIGETSYEQTGNSECTSQIQVSIEQPMKATIKPTNLQASRKNSNCNVSIQMNQTLASTNQSQNEKHIK